MSFNLFVFCARVDKLYQKNLVTHLSMLQRRGIITVTVSDETRAKKKIVKCLGSANIVVLLISADFTESDLCDKIMRLALAKKDAMPIIPVIVRPMDYEEAPFAKLKMLPPGDNPANCKPVSKWQDRDDAWVEVVEQIKLAIKNLTLRP